MKLRLASVLTIATLALLVMPRVAGSQSTWHTRTLSAVRHGPQSSSRAPLGLLGCWPTRHCPALSAVPAVPPPRGQRSCYAPATPGAVCMYGRGFFPHEWVQIDYTLTIHFMPTGTSRAQTLNPTSGQAPGITCLTRRSNGCRYTLTDMQGDFGPLPVTLTYFGTTIPQDYQSTATGHLWDRQSIAIPHLVAVAPAPHPAPSQPIAPPPSPGGSDPCTITCG
jgi:hypothetical protein